MNIGWGLTSKCNSQCKHCYNASGMKEFKGITFEEAKVIVDKLAANGVETINYGTGESGLIDYFWDLVKYTYNKGIIQGLTTNGSSINENTIEYVKKYLNDVDVSIDYPEKEKDNDFRGSEKAWDWAINACKLLKENNISFSIVTCMHSQNATEENVDKFLKLCKEYNCEWRINWFKPTGRGKLNDKFILSVEKVYEIFKYIVTKANIVALPDPYFSAIIGLNTRVASPCGTESFRITPNTEVVPCVYFTKEMKSTSILENSYEEVIHSEVMEKTKNRDIEYCKDCEYYEFCKGGCVSRAYLEYGDINAPDAFCYKKHGLKENPLKDLEYTYEHKERKVHENYLCTLIVKPK